MSKLIAAKQRTTSANKLLTPVLLGCVSLALTTALGCRSATDNQIDLLERELRVQEDYIYELEDYVVEYSEKLRQCRSCSPQQTAVYAEEIYEPEQAPRRSKKSTRNRSAKEKSVLENQESDLPALDRKTKEPEISPEDIEVPDDLDLELEEPVGRLDEQPSLQQVAAMAIADNSGSGDVLLIPNPLDYQDAPEEPTEDLSEVEPQVEPSIRQASDEAIAFNDRTAERLEVTQLFQGEGAGQSLETLLTVIEALDANDEPVDLDGEVSLMVMTANDAKPQRIKRWNFTSAETTTAWQSSDLGDGLHLELPLEDVQLPAGPLELWVRLVTTEGRKILTQLPFEPGQLRGIPVDVPQPQTNGLMLAETEDVIVEPSKNSLRPKSNSRPASKPIKLADSQESADKPRWRSSMQRTDRTSAGFATSSSKSLGWKRQAPGRQINRPARIATRPLPASPQSTAQPTWSSSQAIVPATGTATRY